MVEINSTFSPKERAKFDNAQADTAANTLNIDDLMNAIAELGMLYAEQDDALVELAELIEEV